MPHLILSSPSHMSSLSVNICLVLAALVFSPVFTPLFHSRISTGNDQGASGYMIILVFIIHLLFFGLVTFASFSIARHGGFDWVSQKSTLRTIIVSLGLLSMVTVSAICVMARFANGSGPAFLDIPMRIAPTVIFVLVICTALILNNEVLGRKIPVPLYKFPIGLVSLLCFLALLISGIMAVFSRPAGMEKSTRNYESSPAIIANRITEIEGTDANTNMLRILEFTGRLYPEEVSEKAAAKIKTNPDWQSDLLRLLESDKALYAFSFLASNEVDDKALFPGPVNTGILTVASWIRHSIQGTSPSGFYPDMFSDEVDRVLKTADKFEGMGVDFLPAIKELRSALNEPTVGKSQKFECLATLESWLGKHT